MFGEIKPICCCPHNLSWDILCKWPYLGFLLCLWWYLQLRGSYLLSISSAFVSCSVICATAVVADTPTPIGSNLLYIVESSNMLLSLISSTCNSGGDSTTCNSAGSSALKTVGRTSLCQMFLRFYHMITSLHIIKPHSTLLNSRHSHPHSFIC